MAFSYDSKDVGAALDAGVWNAEALEERPVDFQYKAGSPIRFAGDRIMRNLGTNGEFGSRTNNKEDKEMQQAMLRFTKQWTRGPFAPETIGTASEVA